MTTTSHLPALPAVSIVEQQISDITLLCQVIDDLVGEKKTIDEGIVQWGDVRKDNRILGTAASSAAGGDSPSPSPQEVPDAKPSGPQFKEHLIAVVLAARRIGVIHVIEPPHTTKKLGDDAGVNKKKHPNRKIVKTKDLRLTVDGTTDSFALKLAISLKTDGITLKDIIREAMSKSNVSGSIAQKNQEKRQKSREEREASKLAALEAKLKKDKESIALQKTRGGGQVAVEADEEEEEIEEIEESEEDEEEDTAPPGPVEDGATPPPPEDEAPPPPPEEDEAPPPPPEEDEAPPPPPEEDDAPPPPPEEDEAPPPPPEEEEAPPPPPEEDEAPPPPPEEDDAPPPPN